MNRLWIAMGAYAVLAVLAWNTLTEPIPASGIELRWAMLGFLGLMALLTWMRRSQHGPTGAPQQQRDRG